jgi:hypothetical protein
MKKIIITFLSVAVLLTTFCGKVVSQQKDKDDDDSNSWNGNPPGTWDAVVKDGEVNIQFYGKHWSNRRNFTEAELGALPKDKVGEFSLTRESGKMTFKGVFLDHFGHGTYKFEENESFKSFLLQKGYKDLDKDDLMLSVFFTDINKAYFDFMKENGYAEISDSEFKDLAQQNMNRKVMEDYFNLFKEEKYGHQKLERIVELREHGVTPKYIASIHQLGYKGFSLDRAEDLRDHGVTADYISSIKKMGYADLTLEKAQDLRDHGVTLNYISSLKQMGYGDVTLDRARELHDHGVTAEFISGMQKLGYKNISLEKAERLRDHGVDTEFIRSINDLGFKNLTLDKAEELRDHGVNAAFIKKVRGKGIKVKTLDDFIKIRDTGFGND